MLRGTSMVAYVRTYKEASRQLLDVSLAALLSLSSPLMQTQCLLDINKANKL